MVVTDQTPAGVAELFEEIESYLPPDRVREIESAYEFAEQSHEGQTRKSGDPYITHPIAVTRLVAALHMDPHTLQASLLHDVIEDCDVTATDLRKRFGVEVATLVEGATKIERIGSPDSESADAETLRKMFVAMAEDVRVVILKIADRLHNMRTLQFVSPETQQEKAHETMDIYAPLASRLGIWQFKWELEDLAFRYLEPEQYRRVASVVNSRRGERERFVHSVEEQLRDALDDSGIDAEVSGRVKHLYSIHDKMQRYQADGRSFDQIHDLLALRILVDSTAAAYNALGVVHETWPPIPGSFDDYIANPKESMYQSLHTAVMGPEAHAFEVQIRTYEMHDVAEYGVAAHWQYKEESSKRDHRDEERMVWLRQLIEWQQEASGTEDFLESVKTDVFRDQVFVYTPQAEVRVLPAGSTPIDFAYRIHTDLGHQCAGAKVNGRLVPLSTKLENGDVVEIQRGRKSAGPSRDWLVDERGYLGSSHARQKVRQWFRRQLRGENITRGRELLERERKRLGLTTAPVDLPADLGFDDHDDMLAAIGYGDVSQQHLIQKLADQAPQPDPSQFAPSHVSVRGSPAVRVLGTTGLHVVLARCCNPLPGDGIMGYVTRARGVSVHRNDCRNVINADERDRLVECDWGPSGELYTAGVQVHAWDRVGLLRDVSTLIAGERVNMVGVRTEEHDDRTTTLHVMLETEGGSQFSGLLSRLEGIRGVITVSRADSQGAIL
jgi:GTP pyrophosphokinase